MAKIKKFFKSKKTLFFLAAALILAASLISQASKKPAPKEIPIGEFLQMLKTDEAKKIEDVKILEGPQIIRYKKDGQLYSVSYPQFGFLSQNPTVLEGISKGGAKVAFVEQSNAFSAFTQLLSLAIAAALLYFLMKGNGMSQFDYKEIKGEKVRFANIAGFKFVKEELWELVDFLKNPEKYRRYTDKIPKGVLLEGPPGNGKTLLAKAVAGETDTPFFQVSASDLEGSFVGIGSFRIGRLFKAVRAKAKKYGRAILFIDEIDAIGGGREKRTVVETNQTINKLLTELDGFDKDSNILVIAATNLASSLDRALTRAGRFDRIVTVPKPGLEDRKAVLLLYLQKRGDLIAPEVFAQNYASTLAMQTEGLCNADFDKLVNEACLIAMRGGKERVDIGCLRESFTRIVAGIRVDRKLSKEDRRLVAYHEAGHAVAQIATSRDGFKSVAYITLTPYGEALGHVVSGGGERPLSKMSDLENEVKILLAGRAVEDKLLKGDFTTGAAGDLQQASRLLWGYLAKYGMGASSRNLFVENLDENNEAFQAEIAIVRERLYEETKELIEAHYGAVEKIAEKLLSSETIDQSELPELLRGTSLEQAGA